jgi:hypothetical protein
MKDALDQQPRLRPLEAFPLSGVDGSSGGGDGASGVAEDGCGAATMFALCDPTGISESVLTMSEPALYLMTLFDGSNTLRAARQAFFLKYGQIVEEVTLLSLVDRLESALMLESDGFLRHLEESERAFRESRTRASIFSREFPTAEDAREVLGALLQSNGSVTSDGTKEAGLVGELDAERIAGVIAPHLDFPRGGACYAAAYGALMDRPCPDRVVIFGTNHFGRSMSVVGTGKAFETPLGVTEVDTAFLDRIEARCGVGLRAMESDHRREHSIELQLLCLQYLYGAGAFTIVPFLIPDPCGPGGTESRGDDGVGLSGFLEAMEAELLEDAGDTLLVAGADMSHVGAHFGDVFELDDAYLQGVEERDRRALSAMLDSNAEGFVRAVAEAGNPTRVCSAGCMYAVSRLLRDSDATLLEYHQAWTPEMNICVSCAAVAFTR